MALTKTQKQELVAQVVEKLGKHKSLVFSLYSGLKASEMTELRKVLREAGSELQIVKNKLLEISLKEAGIPTDGISFEGPLAVAYSYDDEVGAAKALAEFAKKHPALQIMSGVLENKVLSAPEVTALAKLPSRDQLIAMTVMTIKAPLTGLVGVMSGTMRKFVRTLQLMSEKSA